MTGQLRCHAALPPHNPKEHIHIVWELDSGSSARSGSAGTVMTFADPRRFGGLAGLDSLATLEDRWATLGPDALTTPLDDLTALLITELGRANRAVKAALLDQRIIAGVGNIYADEALFAARIHPRKLARRLSPDRVRLLATHIREILTRAVDAGGSTLRDYVNADGTKVPCQFPADQGATPVEATCCADLGGPDADGDERCDSNPGAWDDAPWSALSFQMNDQHYFIYSYDYNDALLDAAQFTARNGRLLRRL
jgi:hypothetical protein